MQPTQLQNDSLVEIATFLVRRWSEKDNVIIEISEKTETKTRLKEKKVILTPLEKELGMTFKSTGSLERHCGMRPCESNIARRFSAMITRLDLFSTPWKPGELRSWEGKFGRAWIMK